MEREKYKAIAKETMEATLREHFPEGAPADAAAFANAASLASVATAEVLAAIDRQLQADPSALGDVALAADADRCAIALTLTTVFADKVKEWRHEPPGPGIMTLTLLVLRACECLLFPWVVDPAVGRGYSARFAKRQAEAN